jgi:hypothetical protein
VFVSKQAEEIFLLHHTQTGSEVNWLMAGGLSSFFGEVGCTLP